MGSVALDTFVLFVDMLGFADLVEEQGDQIGNLRPVFKELSLYSPTSEGDLLSYRFVNFHRCLQSARLKLQDARSGTAIVFSDSAFVQLDDFAGLVNLARELMYALITCDIPARMGIARGSFRYLRFTTDATDQMSFHASQFLGSGVVRAYKAEHCGLPGVRIFLHPLVEPLLNDKEALRVIATEAPGKDPAVRYEVNYLETDGMSHDGLDYADVIPFDSLRNMIALSDEAFHYHYIATFDAMNAMRGQLGREPYSWEKCVDRDKWQASHGYPTAPAT